MNLRAGVLSVLLSVMLLLAATASMPAPHYTSIEEAAAMAEKGGGADAKMLLRLNRDVLGVKQFFGFLPADASGLPAFLAQGAREALFGLPPVGAPAGEGSRDASH